jgi:hypothetical protein
MEEKLKVLGIDVSKADICCHILEDYPKGGLGNYWKKASQTASKMFPRFYSNPKSNQKSYQDFMIWVEEQSPNLAVLEPTGTHYSRLPYLVLKRLGVEIKWVGHMELKRFREGKNLPGHGKNDPVDALCMACYPFDPEHQDESGILDNRFFLLSQPEEIIRLRDLVQQLSHLDRVQNPIINYTRQRLAHEFPEAAHQRIGDTDYAPALWAFIGNCEAEASRIGLTKTRKKYETSICHELGIEFEKITRTHARWLVELHIEQVELDTEIQNILDLPQFETYNEILDEFGFGLRTKARLLTRIYPFESFLLENSKEWIEREFREVKHIEKTREKDSVTGHSKTVIKFSPGDTKEVKKNRSRDSFKMRLGMGTIFECSGDDWIEKSSGSSMCRKALFLHTLTKVETGHLPKTEVNELILERKDKLKDAVDANGKPLLNGKHVQGKLMSKTVNLMYKRFLHRFGKK